MPAISRSETGERLARAVEKASSEDLIEIYAELYPEVALAGRLRCSGPHSSRRRSPPTSGEGSSRRKWSICGTSFSPRTATFTTTRRTKPCGITRVGINTRSRKASALGAAHAG